MFFEVMLMIHNKYNCDNKHLLAKAFVTHLSLYLIFSYHPVIVTKIENRATYETDRQYCLSRYTIHLMS